MVDTGRKFSPLLMTKNQRNACSCTKLRSRMVACLVGSLGWDHHDQEMGIGYTAGSSCQEERISGSCNFWFWTFRRGNLGNAPLVMRWCEISTDIPWSHPQYSSTLRLMNSDNWTPYCASWFDTSLYLALILYVISHVVWCILRWRKDKYKEWLHYIYLFTLEIHCIIRVKHVLTRHSSTANSAELTYHCWLLLQ